MIHSCAMCSAEAAEARAGLETGEAELVERHHREAGERDLKRVVVEQRHAGERQPEQHEIDRHPDQGANNADRDRAAEQHLVHFFFPCFVFRRVLAAAARYRAETGLAPHAQVEHLHPDRERHGEVDVALGHVEVEAVGDERHADHDEEA